VSYDVLHLHMIISIRHKGLRQYYEEGNGAKLPHDQLSKISRILDALDAVSGNDDIRALGSGIHKLTGDMNEFWSIKVSANYRIIFRFEAGNIHDVDYQDYH
jgi:toxin HigB-1